MPEKYYYFRDEENKPVVTVCIMKTSDNEIARGVAICSKNDIPNKKIGRSIAKGRAIRALRRRDVGLPVKREEAADILFDNVFTFSYPFMYKSSLNYDVTDFEKRMFGS